MGSRIYGFYCSKCIRFDNLSMIIEPINKDANSPIAVVNQVNKKGDPKNDNSIATVIIEAAKKSEK